METIKKTLQTVASVVSGDEKGASDIAPIKVGDTILLTGEYSPTGKLPRVTADIPKVPLGSLRDISSTRFSTLGSRSKLLFTRTRRRRDSWGFMARGGMILRL